MPFGGETYDRPRDGRRLGAQLLRVLGVLADLEWHTLAGISKITGDPEASISARIRDFRKETFGAHEIEAEYVRRGLWRYRLIPRRPPPSPTSDQYQTQATLF